MLRYRHAVRQAAQKIAGVTHRTVLALSQGRIEHEPAMTDRFLGAVEERLYEFEIKGIQWRAKTLTDRGPHSQESKFGADFVGVLNINLPEFSVSKGFLAQAKMVRHGSVDGIAKLKSQCRRMLDLTTESFVFLYDNAGIRIVPAISVLGTEFDPTELYSRSAERFFEEHFQCFIGDRAINAPTPQVLEGLRQRFETQVAMSIGAEG